MSASDFEIPFDRLPADFAESVEHPPAVPAVPRPAATIVLLRDGERGVEALLLKRARTSGFVPGAYVFPGGRVDRADAGDELLAHTDGLDETAAAERLDLHRADPPAMAYYLAALREAFEETGILIARRGDGSVPPTAARDGQLRSLRERLMEEDVTFADVLHYSSSHLDGRSVEYLAHWITPEVEPRRYDTRFFAASVRSDTEAIIDRREMTDAVWLTPTAALRRYREGTLPMVFPTIKTLQQLEPFSTAAGVLADLATRSIPTILPRLVVTPTGVGLEIE